MSIRQRISSLTKNKKKQLFKVEVKQTVNSLLDKFGIDEEEAEAFYRKKADHCTLPTPKQIPVDDLFRMVQIPYNPSLEIEQVYRDRVQSPLTAIRAFCVMCYGGSPSKARRCQQVSCPLWVFRMGSNPFYGKKSNK